MSPSRAAIAGSPAEASLRRRERRFTAVAALLFAVPVSYAPASFLLCLWVMVRRGVVAFALIVALVGCGHVAREVGPNEVVTVAPGETVNGDLECSGGVVSVLAGATVNGDIVGDGCTMKIFAGNNGDIVATGGSLLAVRGASTVNGGLDTEGVARVRISQSTFNGGLDVLGSYEVTVTDSYFNGSGSIVGVVDAVAIENDFNGDFEIRDVEACEAIDNRTNGDLRVSGCD